jgi:hypothetical protein
MKLNKTNLYGDDNLSPVIVSIAVECVAPVAWHLDQAEYDTLVKRIAYALQAEHNDLGRLVIKSDESQS